MLASSDVYVTMQQLLKCLPILLRVEDVEYKISLREISREHASSIKVHALSPLNDLNFPRLLPLHRRSGHAPKRCPR